MKYGLVDLTPVLREAGFRRTLAYVILLVLVVISSRVPTIQAGETPRCEALGVVVRVVDGDTVDVSNITYYDELIAARVNSTRVRVRFADVNAPELGTVEGEEARRALAEIVEAHGGVVCLDVDNLRTLDPYGRVIAVVYLRVNETHYLNLNKWLLVNNYAEVRDFADNEFNPVTWRLYAVFQVEAPEITSTPAKTPLIALWDYLQRFGLVLAMVVLALLILMGFATRSKRKARRRYRTWR